ncbi:MAG: DNA-directed RNA polymerase subunit delta [Bacilli bacterium]
MKFKSVTKEDLETMSFDNIAYTILKEKNKKMKTTELFKIICDTLELGDKAYEEQIADFFTLLATEKRFIQLEKGYWDLKDNHQTKLDISSVDEDDDDIELGEDSTEEDTEIFYDDKDADEDSEDDDLKDLVVVDEDEEGETL